MVSSFSSLSRRCEGGLSDTPPRIGYKTNKTEIESEGQSLKDRNLPSYRRRSCRESCHVLVKLTFVEYHFTINYYLLDKATAIRGQLTFIAVLNDFLSITASLGNALVLLALRKDSSLHSPSKLLLRNLAVTDLCAGLFSEPLYVPLLVTVVNEHWNICAT